MAGDDRVRFCAQCERNVFDLSAMMRKDAEALVRETEGRLCARYYRRADGTILTADCPEGVRRAWLRLVLAIVGSVATWAGIAACGTYLDGHRGGYRTGVIAN